MCKYIIVFMFLVMAQTMLVMVPVLWPKHIQDLNSTNSCELAAITINRVRNYLIKRSDSCTLVCYKGEMLMNRRVLAE